MDLRWPPKTRPEASLQTSLPPRDSRCLLRSLPLLYRPTPPLRLLRTRVAVVGVRRIYEGLPPQSRCALPRRPPLSCSREPQLSALSATRRPMLWARLCTRSAQQRLRWGRRRLRLPNFLQEASAGRLQLPLRVTCGTLLPRGVRRPRLCSICPAMAAAWPPLQGACGCLRGLRATPTSSSALAAASRSCGGRSAWPACAHQTRRSSCSCCRLSASSLDIVTRLAPPPQCLKSLRITTLQRAPRPCAPVTAAEQQEEGPSEGLSAMVRRILQGASAQ